MDESQLAIDYADRLFDLRKRTEGRWRDEVQLALDACEVADNVELKFQKGAVQNVLPKGTLKGVGAAGEKEKK